MVDKKKYRKGQKKTEPPRDPEPRSEPLTEQPESEQTDILNNLKSLGIDQEQVMQIVEGLVVKVISKMKLGENINKRLTEIESKLTEQIQPVIEIAQQVQSNGGSASAGDDALKNQVLSMIANKLINPDSGAGNFDGMVKMMDSAKKLSDIFVEPFVSGQIAKQKEISETLKMLRDAGATPEKARDVIIERTK